MKTTAVIHELWILNKAGLDIFHSNNNSEKSTKDASFIAAIDCFSRGLSDKSIQSIHFEKNLLIFHKRPNIPLLFVMRVNYSKNETLFRTIILEISEKFITQFHTSNFENGNITRFRQFQSEIEPYLIKESQERNFFSNLMAHINFFD